MNLQEMILEVRSAIGDSSAAFWSDGEIIRWLNQAVRIMCSHALPLQAIHAVTLVASQQEYALPADVVRVFSVKYTDGSRVDNLYPTDPATAQSGGLSTGRPYYFYLRNRGTQTGGQISTGISVAAIVTARPNMSRFVLGLVPVPSAAKTCIVSYFSSGMVLSHDGDEPPFGEEYHDGVCAYAIAKAKEKDEDHMAAQQIYLPRFSEYVEKLKSQGVLDGQDYFPAVNVLGEDIVDFRSPLDPRFLLG